MNKLEKNIKGVQVGRLTRAASSPHRGDSDRLRPVQTHRGLPFHGERQREAGQRSVGHQLLRHRQLAGYHGRDKQRLQQGVPLGPRRLHHQTFAGDFFLFLCSFVR